MIEAATELILHLGSNEHDRLEYLRRAIRALQSSLGVIQNVSKIYETEAWGVENQADFLNLAIKLQTNIREPHKVLSITQSIEHAIGRQKSRKWGPRSIDIDILDFNGAVIHDALVQIPHPGIVNRNFVLYPLKDICPDYRHPISNSLIDRLIEETPDCKTVWVTEYTIRL